MAIRKGLEYVNFCLSGAQQERTNSACGVFVRFSRWPPSAGLFAISIKSHEPHLGGRSSFRVHIIPKRPRPDQIHTCFQTLLLALMISIGAGKTICSSAPKRAAQLSRAAAPLFYQVHTPGLGYSAALRVAAVAHLTRQPSPSRRDFSTSRAAQLRDYFPAKETAFIRRTPPAWPHPGYTDQELLSIVPEHREPKTLGDWTAWKLVRLCRYVRDIETPSARR